MRPTRVAPLAIFLREDAAWLLAAPQPRAADSLSHPAREVLAALESQGACLLRRPGARHRPAGQRSGRRALGIGGRGLVTADGFENLRALLDPKRRRGEGRGRRARPRHAPGRWDLLRRVGSRRADARNARSAFARQLLLRWGVVFRDAAAREPLAPAWRDLLVALRRMESRGEIRGGRFLAAFVGEQFALPEALDLLRAIRRTGETAPAPDGPGPWASLGVKAQPIGASALA